MMSLRRELRVWNLEGPDVLLQFRRAPDRTKYSSSSPWPRVKCQHTIFQEIHPYAQTYIQKVTPVNLKKCVVLRCKSWKETSHKVIEQIQSHDQHILSRNVEDLNVSSDWIGHQGTLISLLGAYPYRDQQNLGWPPKAGSIILIPNSKTQSKRDLLKMLLSMVKFKKISVACFNICSGLDGIINIFRSVKMLNNTNRDSTFQQYSCNVFTFVIPSFKKLLCGSYFSQAIVPQC